MIPEAGHRQLLAAVIAAGFLLRLGLFTGFALGDDVFYQLQAIAHGIGGVWPPEPYHWETRLGITLPTAALFRAFGLARWVPIIVPLAASTVGIWVTYRIAREFVDHRTALIAAVFQATYPLEVVYSTQLFPDVPVALFESLSLWFWIRALRSERRSDYAWAGAYFGMAYLCRETVLMAGPAYIALWGLHRRWRRPGVAWSAMTAMAFPLSEMVLYWLSAGNPLYRLQAMASRQLDPSEPSPLDAASGFDFWIDPVRMLITNHEFGLYQAALVPALVYAWRRFPALRALIVWWLALFLWSFYGTTVPTAYVSMWRDPRYVSALTVPTVIILAQVIVRLPVTARRLAGAALVASGLVASTLEQGNTLLEPHRRFAASGYAPQAVMEPIEYYGARWVSGLESAVAFRCVTDLGRITVVTLLSHLPGSRCESAAAARYVVFAAERRRDVTATLTALGWKEVARFRAPGSFGRRAIASVLAWIPGQEARASRIREVPALRVFENPAQGS